MAESTLQGKRRLRTELRDRLGGVAPADVAVWSAELCRRVAESEPFRTAKVVMGYVATPEEADPSELMTVARAAGKRVVLPRVDWGLRVMAAAESPASGAAGLVPGRHGILEPPASAPSVPVADIDLVLVPGLGFDEQGYRLGRGAGFYDRFLGHPTLTATSVGLAFEVQMAPVLPRDDWDVRLHAIATDRRWIQIE